MLRKTAVLVLSLGSALVFSSALLAQQAQEAPAAPGGPGFGPAPHMGFPGEGFGPGRFGRMRFRPFGFEPPVKNQPFIATETTTDTFTRKDGSPITHNLTEQKWRDAAGRTRVEVTHPAEGKRPAMHVAEILDPVARTATMLDFNRKVAIVRHLPEPRGGHRPPPPDGVEPRQRPGVTVTEADLPGKQIAGVYATGKQITRTVAAGTHGNSEPITQTSERYISPDLKIVLYSSEKGPRNNMEHQVTALQRVDPNATLFDVPSDFTVRNAPEHGFNGPRGRGFGGPGGPPPPPAPGE